MFTRKEANGFLLIVLLIGLYLFIPYLFRSFFPSEISSVQDQLLLEAWIREMEEVEQKELKSSISSNHELPVYFDPNTASLNQLKNAGIPEWLSERIIKYRTKGGNFENKEDLLKVYGFSNELYKKLSPYIIIVVKSENLDLKVEKDDVKFDINHVTASQLQTIKGIGPVLSERIIKFRDKLGGFITREQVKEVYGLDSLVAKDVTTNSFVTSDYTPKKLNINTEDEKVLASHPYISGYKAKGISFKRAKGRIADLNQLKELKIFSEEELKKIEPYIAF